MSRLTDLVAQAKRENPQLGADLERELLARNQRSFGLVFERHLPELVELPGCPVRKGDTVRVLPERGSLLLGDQTLWKVKTTKGQGSSRVADLVEAQPSRDAGPRVEVGVSVDDLVVIAGQDDMIYPGLAQTGEVLGSDDLATAFHTVINAENYHALRMLTYTHRHSIDCIYIDPPYNTGARDWKYNNDYVDGDDDYRHSKWLSFMERRLNLAKQLLNPENSVLIVTIDEKEYLRLGLLLEQTFPEATIQMISTVISAKGVYRAGNFSRVQEYIYILNFGESKAVRWVSNMLNDEVAVDGLAPALISQPIEWLGLRRREPTAVRGARPNQFYPIYVSRETGSISGIGEAVDDNFDVSEVHTDEGTLVVWPRRKNGTFGLWGLTADVARRNWENGYVRCNFNRKKDQATVYYLPTGTINRVENGEITVTGYASDGSVEGHTNPRPPAEVPRQMWNMKSHNAEINGTNILSEFLPGRRFPFPKSLFAVEDALRFFVKDKPDATVLDFFAGSGTTAHAVMRLNKQDGGNRRSISVTNNEVSAEEQVQLREQGLRPGDAEWEKWGICDYVTKPRIEAAITGRTPEGEPIKGEYKFTDEFAMSDGFQANARFFTLTYEPLALVRHGLAFERVAPMLWLRAGQVGRVIESIPERGWDVAESYGVIDTLAATGEFVEALEKQEGVSTVFVVTDDDLAFQSTAKELSGLAADVDVVRLYSTYLNNFAFQQGQEMF